MPPGDQKRRLPVLQNRDEDEDPERPPWHWAAIGAIAIFIAWYPLAMLAAAWAQRSIEEVAPGGDPEATRAALAALSPGARIWLSLQMVIGPMIALAVAAVLGGLLVGRFGGRAGKKEATVGGLSAAAIAAVVSAPGLLASGQMGLWLMTTLVIVVLAALGARGGAALGLRLRR